jgi:hypothetical protein
MSNSDQKAAVAREGERHMNRLADRLGDLGDDARRSAQQYGELADRAKTR